MIKIKLDWNEYVRQKLRELRDEMITIIIDGKERVGMSCMSQEVNSLVSKQDEHEDLHLLPDTSDKQRSAK